MTVKSVRSPHKGALCAWTLGRSRRPGAEVLRQRGHWTLEQRPFWPELRTRGALECPGAWMPAVGR